MKKNTEFVGHIQADVAVIGGGTAGCFAAIAAARCGASVVLVEKAATLGGTITTAGVAFPGLFHAWGKQIIGGPCWESLCRAAALNGAQIPDIVYHPQYHWQEQVPVNNFVYTSVLDEMCLENNVQVLLHTMLFDAYEDAEYVQLMLACKEGPVLLTAKQAIDATGDADLVRRLGYPILTSDSVQPATLINDLSGYDAAALDHDAFITFMDAQIAEGTLHPRDYQGHSLWTQLQGYRISMHLPVQNAESSAGKTVLEQEARRTLLRIVSVLRRFPGLEHLTVSRYAAECGVRETVRIDGEYCMTSDEYIAAYRYEDAVCHAFYPIDRHTDTGIHQVFLEEEKIPSISFRALQPKGTRRLLVAGRCISCDRDTQSAIRVCAPCMAMGQAAGTAAAIAAQSNLSVREINYNDLCTQLAALGAIIP